MKQHYQEFKKGDRVVIVSVLDPMQAHWKVGDTATWISKFNVRADRKIQGKEIGSMNYIFEKVNPIKDLILEDIEEKDLFKK